MQRVYKNTAYPKDESSHRDENTISSTRKAFSSHPSDRITARRPIFEFTSDASRGKTIFPREFWDESLLRLGEKTVPKCAL